MGWSSKQVRHFLRRQFYTIPCGAVPKNNDPAGRIIHNYSYPTAKAGSVNSALINTSVAYISFKERVTLLEKVDWFIKADLKNGYRQLPVHPSDWYTQIYSLGPNEHYIDINMPFGKANSSKIFCTWTTAWCTSFQNHFQNHYSIPIALSSYVDDFFGGPIRSESLEKDRNNAKLLLKNLISIGEFTNTRMNIGKCLAPARSMNILGIVFNSKNRTCYLPENKVAKYLGRLQNVKRNKSCTSKELEKLIGNLVFASWVIPFGRSFISHISFLMNRENSRKRVALDAVGVAACDVWALLLKRNRGLPFDFILGRLPRQRNEWFTDASPAYGYGGVCGNHFFKISHVTWNSALSQAKYGNFQKLFISYRELLAVLFAFQGFSKFAPSSFIRINSDSTNTVSWLNNGRCPKKLGFLLLSAIQFYKAKYRLRVKAFYIKSDYNTSADELSRGRTPRWLKHDSTKVYINIQQLIKLIDNPISFWKTI